MKPIVKLSITLVLFGVIGVSLRGQSSAAQPATAIMTNDLPAYSRISSGISYFNTPNRHHTTISGSEPAVLGKVAVDLNNESDVLVQFTSGLATTTDEGCPCSYRASLKADDQEPIVIKRINLAGQPSKSAAEYVPDRQSLDGSFVFSLPKGRHELSLIVQQIEGTTKAAQAFYTNIQALPFTRK